MFKLLKSKKGFTLVELMIVVVIMAILVAVAVPIYSAVTRNAREKSCTSNIREMTVQLNSYLMGSVDGVVHSVDDEFVVSSNGERGQLTQPGETFTEPVLNLLFQKIPYCPGGKPDAEVTYTVKVTAMDGIEGGQTTSKIEITCSDVGADGKHK